ncbi:MAG TPA: sulfatase-like hydrolase/transferase [Candidatus Glassbacteria bacterium]|nr:sulfatase-like hydrolase/transferase [Candidatus Glassbacteria bacterium]
MKLLNFFKFTFLALALAACSRQPAIDQAHPPNVLLIVLDAARADRFSCYGYKRPTTPNLDRLAGDGVRYTRAVSTSSWTLPAHASLFTGLLPDEHGCRNRHAWLIDRFPTLAELLKQRGFRTGCFTNNPIIDQFHNLTRGFDRVERIWADSAYVSEARPHNTERTNALLREFVSASDDRPFFAFVNYMDVHQPYDCPEPYRSTYLAPGQEISARVDSACRYAETLNAGALKLSGQEQAALGDIYDGCLRYLDARLGELFAALREAGVYDNTLLIVTSDHGELFGEYGHYGHGTLLNRPLVHIPLIVRFPGLFPASGVKEELVSITDIFPSLAALFGLEGAAPTGGPLRNIFAERIQDAPCCSDFFLGRVPAEQMKHHYDTQSVWTPSDKQYILRGVEAVEYFDLNLDFAEQHNLCPGQATRKEVAAVIEKSWASHLTFAESEVDLQVPAASVAVDPQLERAMRALGYLGPGQNLSAGQEPEHPHVLEHFKTANFLISLDSIPAAEAELRKALAMSQQSVAVRKKLGFVLFSRDRFDEVVGTLAPVVNQETKDPEILLSLGLALAKIGREDNALELLIRASDLEPARLLPALNAADMLIRSGRNDQAGVYVQRIMTYHFGNLPTLLEVMALYLNNKNPAGARDLLLGQLKKAQSGTIYALLGMVYRSMGDQDEAQKCVRQATAMGVGRDRFNSLEQRLNEALQRKK